MYKILRLNNMFAMFEKCYCDLGESVCIDSSCCRSIRREYSKASLVWLCAQMITKALKKVFYSCFL